MVPVKEVEMKQVWNEDGVKYERSVTVTLQDERGVWLTHTCFDKAIGLLVSRHDAMAPTQDEALNLLSEIAEDPCFTGWLTR